MAQVPYLPNAEWSGSLSEAEQNRAIFLIAAVDVAAAVIDDGESTDNEKALARSVLQLKDGFINGLWAIAVALASTSTVSVPDLSGVSYSAIKGFIEDAWPYAVEAQYGSSQE